jgi:osmoprotectant transport system ATP-binding protein
MAQITMDGITKRYPDGYEAVRDMNLAIEDGEFVILVGPSGCGKTTTMKMINRLIEPTSGTIVVDGEDVRKRDPVSLRRHIGYVIQSVGLLPHRTIADNIATVPKLEGWDGEKLEGRTDELMRMLELDDEMRDRYPSELSGGQRQRVGVARALAADPPVLLMDEPFGAVDPIVRGRLQDQFLDLQRKLQKTIVFVTHDVDEAIKMADRIAILNQGGVLEQFASPEEILREPASDFVREFVGVERGLKRLSLIKVADLEVEEGPVVGPSASPEEARAEMRRFELDWVSVVDEGELLGWVGESSLREGHSVFDAEPRPFSAYVTEESSLRHALDSIVTSHTQVAVVVTEGQRYRGILTLERVSREIIS